MSKEKYPVGPCPSDQEKEVLVSEMAQDLEGVLGLEYDYIKCLNLAKVLITQNYRILK